ncbi:MAG TPA: methyltransferase [Candidatus Paceibacterota bacterium]|nr:methyltransferase [Candidatus Paceibacterota bacterium]
MQRPPEQPQTVHEVLARSYLWFLILCSAGLFFDLFFPLYISLPHAQTLGTILLVGAPVLILWAQSASYRFAQERERRASVTEAMFMYGPYKFLRNPTHIGLTLLIWGYAFVTSSELLFITTLAATLISNWYFRKHEVLLEEKYGEPYRRYRASVNTFM